MVLLPLVDILGTHSEILTPPPCLTTPVRHSAQVLYGDRHLTPFPPARKTSNRLDDSQTNHARMDTAWTSDSIASTVDPGLSS